MPNIIQKWWFWMWHDFIYLEIICLGCWLHYIYLEIVCPSYWFYDKSPCDLNLHFILSLRSETGIGLALIVLIFGRKDIYMTVSTLLFCESYKITNFGMFLNTVSRVGLIFLSKENPPSNYHTKLVLFTLVPRIRQFLIRYLWSNSK